MRSLSPSPQGLSRTVIIAGVFFATVELTWSQETSPPAATLPPTMTAPTDASPGVSYGDPAVTEGCASSTAPSSPWSKVPPVTPLPRPGWFIIPPTGPGYYSLKDVVTDTYRQQPPKYPYPPTSIIPNSYYDADYRYLDDPNNTQFDWSDFYKRIHIGDNWLLSIGGEERGSSCGRVAYGHRLDLHALPSQLAEDRRFADAGHAPARKDVEQSRFTATEIRRCNAGLAWHCRRKRKLRKRALDQL